ncbi:hypothetical protein QBC34DRAFT_352097 [Podospora aff. communis PSN243]|uniref:Uncharacterized protein n=1 Tax=Podospora aff. communis PSN243 TaxID=3040156 RepID=A0AAV9GJD8_9PEZI|nr:hypothetical protein QBC34DRAFT_352097 [Podospora aff. communis PSN243]
MTQLNDNTPVFCTAEIPDALLNAFFREAYAAPGLADEGIDDVGVLINTTDPSTITHPTKVPVPPQPSFPFTGKTPEEIWAFAQQHVNPPIFNRALAILDATTVEDGRTCLLVTTWENPPAAAGPGRDGNGNGEQLLLKARAEFRFALEILNVKNLGIGGDEHFRAGAEGIVRGGE